MRGGSVNRPWDEAAKESSECLRVALGPTQATPTDPGTSDLSEMWDQTQEPLYRTSPGLLPLCKPHTHTPTPCTLHMHAALLSTPAQYLGNTNALVPLAHSLGKPLLDY